MTRGQLARRLRLLAPKLVPRRVLLLAREKSITECGGITHALAQPPINYVSCRFVAFKDDAIKFSEVEAEALQGRVLVGAVMYTQSLYSHSISGILSSPSPSYLWSE